MTSIVEVCSPAPRCEWQELFEQDASALIEHGPVWVDAIEASTRQRDASRLYRFRDGRRFVLPLVAASFPRAPASGFANGWGIGGVVGPDLDDGIVAEIARDLASSRAVYTHIRPSPLQADCWSAAGIPGPTVIARRAHVVDVSGGCEAAWAGLHKSGRRGVRKSEQAGVETTLHLGGDQLDAYYEELYLASLERWAKRQREPLALARFRAQRRDPLSKLKTIGRTLGDSFRLYLAWIDGALVAGNIVLWGPRNAHATRGASNEIGRASSASYALEWQAIFDASDDGFHSYHLGESGQNVGLALYKERFGAVGLDYAEYRFERLPVHAVDTALRGVVKKVIGFRDH